MKKDQLHNLEVTPEDIDAGYHPVHQKYNDYLAVMSHAARRTHNTLRDFVKENGVVYSRTSKRYQQIASFFRNWVQKDKPPYSVKAILALHELGIFPASDNAQYEDPKSRLIHGEIKPFDHKNELLPLANLLSCLGYWRGYNLSQATGSGNSCDFYKKYLDPSVVELIEKLIGRRIHTAESNKRISLDAIYSRLLKALGIIEGCKTESNRAIPLQVRLALNSLKNEEASEDEINIALSIIKDFVLTFFVNDKCKFSASRGFSSNMPFSHSDKIAEERSDALRDSIEFARFDFSTRAQRNSQMGGKRFETPTYSRVIFFDGIDETMISGLKDDFRTRVEEIGVLI